MTLSFLGLLIICLTIKSSVSIGLDKFIIDNCPSRSDIITTRNTLNITIRYSRKYKYNLVLFVTREGKNIFDYDLASNRFQQNYTHITFEKHRRQRKYDLRMRFRDNDAGKVFILYYSFNKNKTKDKLCTITINNNFKAKPKLYRHAAVEIGNRLDDTYFEGDRVLITCALFQVYRKTNFTVELPKEANAKLVKRNIGRKVYSVYLTKKIKNKPVRCVLSDGTAVLNEGLLTYVEKPKPTLPTSKRGLALFLTMIFAFVACVTLPVSTYLLIIKQRQNNTHFMVLHRKNEVRKKWRAQSKMKSKSSRLSRMSQITRSTNSQIASAHEVSHLGFMRHI